MKNALLFILLLLFLAASVPADEPATLTVLDFEVNNISEKDMKSIVSYLSASIFDTGLYRVIDTAQRDTILEEMEFSLSGCTDESCQLEVGRLLSAEIIVTGDISLVGGRYICTARMLDTETSETLASAKTIRDDLGSLIDGMPSFARRLCGLEEEATDIASERTRTPGSFRKIASWSTLGLGVAASGVGGYLIYAALDYRDTYVAPARAAYEDDTVTDFGGLTPDEYYTGLYKTYEGYFTEFKGKALTALILSGAGILSLGTSAALFLIPEKPEAEVSFSFLPLPDACSFRCSISY